MEIRVIPISSIQRAVYNPRKTLTPSDPSYQKMKKSIQAFGLVEPLVWNEFNSVLVGGHQRLTILENESHATEVEVSVVHIEDIRQEKALNLALNRQGGEWDEPALTAMLKELKEASFDLDLTGFEEAEFKKMIKAATSADLSDTAIPEKFIVLIECSGELHQAQILERLLAEGLTCRRADDAAFRGGLGRQAH